MRVADIKVGNRHRKDMGDLPTLADSIREEGLLQPIGVTEGGDLVFGERRLRAARLLGLETIDAHVVQVTSILAGEYAENEVRKEFTISERVNIAEAVARAAGERRGRPSENNVQKIAQLAQGKKTREIAAEKSGFGNHETYRQAKKVMEHGAPELVAAMDKGAIPPSVACVITALPFEEQRAIVASDKPDVRARQAAYGVRRYEKIGHLIARGTPKADEALGRFAVVLADPPWSFGNRIPSRHPENHYPTMEIETICRLLETTGLAKHLLPDCSLFLWSPPAMLLNEAARVIEAWGFTFLTGAVWDKETVGFGAHFRMQHEHLLLATRGNMPTPGIADRPSSIIRAPRGRHSEKPAVVYDIIERMYPELPKLELFARQQRAGWVSCGNEASLQQIDEASTTS
jgi:N6-adenosine-specific RNA methylase IME4